MLTQELLKELLDYDQETGKLTWKRRERKWFKSDRQFKTWNSRYAEKEAFTALNDKGYCHGHILSKSYKAQRVIWLYMIGEWPKEIDHINHDRKDNRWFNLREVSHQENCENRSKYSFNKSGQTGVYWHKTSQKWRSVIGRKNLGCFDLLEDAITARKVADMKYNYHENHGK